MAADPNGTANSAPASQLPGARGFLQRLEQALSDLATLRIVTVVADVDVTGVGATSTLSVRANAPVEGASTEIDLLNGRITNIASPGFAAQDGGSLRAFHQAQVERSSAIVAGTLAELQRLAGALLSARR